MTFYNLPTPKHAPAQRRAESPRPMRRPFPAQVYFALKPLPAPPPRLPSFPAPKPPKPAFPPIIRPAPLPIWQRPLWFVCDLLDAFRYVRRRRHAA